MEDIDISRAPVEPAPVEILKEGHHFRSYIVFAFGLMILAIVIFIGFQYITVQKTPFNIPTDKDHLILYDNNALYAFDPTSGELDELGVFEIGGTISEVVISDDLTTIVLVADDEIFSYTSFTDGAKIATHDAEIVNITTSNDSVLFSSGELDENNERSIFQASDEEKEFFAVGTTPFFLDSGTKAVISTLNGFRMFDLDTVDFLDSETPTIPQAKLIQPSRSGNKLALLGMQNSVHVYSVISSRPVTLFEDFFLTTPGITDIAVNDDGLLAFLRPINNQSYISIYDSNTKKQLGEGVSLGVDAKIIIWSK